jgi:hypothetical protein
MEITRGERVMLEMIAVYVENGNLKMENARLRAKLADLRAMNRAFTSDTEVRINNLIHKIKCRDEVPNRIFLGKKEWDALKEYAKYPNLSDATPDLPAPDARYMGFEVVRVNKATFVDVSTR